MADSRTILKEFFETGDKPTQAQFASLIDSLLSLVDDSNLKNGIKIKSQTDGKIQIIFSDSSFTLSTDGDSFVTNFFILDPAIVSLGSGLDFLNMEPNIVELRSNEILRLISTAGNIELILETGGWRVEGLSIFADNAAAVAGGLTTNTVYKTATGELRIVT